MNTNHNLVWVHRYPHNVTVKTVIDYKEDTVFEWRISSETVKDWPDWLIGCFIEKELVIENTFT